MIFQKKISISIYDFDVFGIKFLKIELRKQCLDLKSSSENLIEHLQSGNENPEP